MMRDEDQKYNCIHVEYKFYIFMFVKKLNSMKENHCGSIKVQYGQPIP